MGRFVSLAVLIALCPVALSEGALTAQAVLERKPERLDVPTGAWQSDLDALVAGLRARHPNLYHRVPKSVFDRRVAEIRAELPSLTGGERAVRLMEVAALAGDGHTRIGTPLSFRRVPLQFDWIEDAFRITGAARGETDLLGARLVAVGGVGVGEAVERVRAIVPQGETEPWSRVLTSRFLIDTDVLFALHLSPDASRVQYRLRTVSGDLVTPDVEGFLPAQSPALQGLCPDSIQPTNPPAFDAEVRRGVLEVQFQQYLLGRPRRAFRDATRALMTTFDRAGVAAIAFDVRRNTGGDFTRAREFLLPALEERVKAGRLHRIYVLIGPETSSAPVVTAIDLHARLHAELVGEPTGTRPNSYSEARFFSLPATGLFVSVSTRRYDFWPTDADGVAPDHLVPRRWSDVAACRDAAMAFVLSDANRGTRGR